jgi:hypothetical protein
MGNMSGAGKFRRRVGENVGEVGLIKNLPKLAARPNLLENYY